MKNKAYFLFVYSLIAFIGGMIGFLKTGSLMSIISASVIATVLIGCGIAMVQGKEIAYKMSIGLLLFVLVFFGYRYILTAKIMPAGMMILVTVITLSYLFIGNHKLTKKES